MDAAAESATAALEVEAMVEAVAADALDRLSFDPFWEILILVQVIELLLELDLQHKEVAVCFADSTEAVAVAFAALHLLLDVRLNAHILLPRKQ